MARVEAICISRKKGTIKKAVHRVELRADYGIVGDAHAGDWHRQISLLSLVSINSMREVLPNLAYGAFAENIVIADMDFTAIAIGDQIALGRDIILEITQIGKECHT